MAKVNVKLTESQADREEKRAVKQGIRRELRGIADDLDAVQAATKVADLRGVLVSVLKRQRRIMRALAD